MIGKSKKIKINIKSIKIAAKTIIPRSGTGRSDKQGRPFARKGNRGK